MMYNNCSGHIFQQAVNKGEVMQTRVRTLLVVAALSTWGVAKADITVPMNMVDEKGAGKPVGQVVISESPYGLVFTPALTGLPPGLHGFHVHENASCDPKEKDGKMVAALAAGGHYDPVASKHHGLPWGDGHLGDLPALAVDGAGNANNPVLAPRLKMADVKGRSLMVHAGGDNHADHPAVLGGGGARAACGVIQ
jgi:superoxide dismutase, Cu-Zn family